FLFIDFKLLKMAFKQFECSAQMFIESVTSGVSVWITAALTFERCVVIFKTTKCRQQQRKRAIICIIAIISFSLFVNLLFLMPGYYRERLFNNRTITIFCLYGTDDLVDSNSSIITGQIKFYYTLSTVIFRTVIPFILLLVANIVLFICLRKYRTTHTFNRYSFTSSKTKQSPLIVMNTKQSVIRKHVHSNYATLTSTTISNSKKTSLELIKHGRVRRVTPMIFFSSLVLILTVSPRYLLQFYLNIKNPHLPCIHLLIHLLKTLELCNYAFNVSISIIAGKQARNELSKMLRNNFMSHLPCFILQRPKSKQNQY
ncbi:unnamed protein product, partial [Didymodactylos carnosus]